MLVATIGGSELMVSEIVATPMQPLVPAEDTVYEVSDGVKGVPVTALPVHVYVEDPVTENTTWSPEQSVVLSELAVRDGDGLTETEIAAVPEHPLVAPVTVKICVTDGMRLMLGTTAPVDHV